MRTTPCSSSARDLLDDAMLELGAHDMLGARELEALISRMTAELCDEPRVVKPRRPVASGI
ncbi:MAG: hypothetical protein IPH07_22085 [Deltaproteobacteria bacterium]|nr:hypothetical protein [Deltaproteobacteria bacterium]MBK8714338.1 hypothetical protein [Deltaproteobacteria bacterium]MBP7285874.1 hypothetical protein [Nannocystaceae bacterium]